MVFEVVFEIGSDSTSLILRSSIINIIQNPIPKQGHEFRPLGHGGGGGVSTPWLWTPTTPPNYPLAEGPLGAAAGP